MDRDFDFNLKANGNVTGCRFVKLDATEDEACLQAGNLEETIGIAGEGTRNAPGTAGDDGFIAVAGENVPVFGPGRKCLLELGGTVTRGEKLVSNASGQGVAAGAYNSATPQLVGARALQSGVSGDKVLVLVEQYVF